MAPYRNREMQALLIALFIGCLPKLRVHDRGVAFIHNASIKHWLIEGE
jgi:hypothetical protein